MADPQGFLKTRERELPRRRPVPVRIMDWKEVYEEQRRHRAAAPGRPLHGLRHPVLPPGLPARQPDPRVERPGLARRLARRPSSACTRPTTSRSSPGGCARRRASRRACSASTSPRSRSSRSRSPSSTGPSPTARVSPQPPERLTGKTVAVVGSGPAGLAAAQQLTRAGHTVAVFERADRIGGLLRYGIPEFKMEKSVLDRRLAQMEAEGTRFRAGVEVGKDITGADLRSRYDAVVVAIGATVPRDLPVPGRDLDGVHSGHGLPAAGQPGRPGPERRATRSPPRASTSSSSAAATPAPTASARRTARVPAR